MTLVLKPTQRQILLLRSRGLSNKQIADALERRVGMIEYHVTAALKNNPEHNSLSLFAEFVRGQCREGVWE